MTRPTKKNKATSNRTGLYPGLLAQTLVPGADSDED